MIYVNRGLANWVRQGQLGGAGGLTFHLRDDFTTDAAAPLASPRTAEPGPGTLTLVQVDGEFSTSGGKLVFPAQASAAWGDQGILDIARTRVAGRALLTKILGDFGATALVAGWQNANAIYRNTAAEAEAALGTTTSASLLAGNAGAFTGVIATLVTATEYQLAIALRDTGAFYFINGGAFTSWTLLWVGATGTTATNYAAFSNYSTVGTLDSFRVLDLPAPFNDDYGLATQRLAGAQSAGQTFTHEANCVLEWTQTTLPSDEAYMFFRIQDGSNLWFVYINTVGNFTLYKQVAGVNTNVASAAAVIANGHRIVIVCDGTTIRGYSNNVLRFTYSSATEFATATAGELNSLGTGGAVSDICSFPRTLTGAAAALLDQAIA